MKTLSLSLKDIYPIMEQAFSENECVHLTVRGNSMSPFLRDGRDTATFSALQGRKICKGDIVFYQRAGGQFVMHRVYSVETDGTMTMLGDAQWTLEKGIRPDQLRAYVTKVTRKGQEISCEKGFYRRLMTLWQLRIRFPRLARLWLKILHLPFGVKRRIDCLLKK